MTIPPHHVSISTPNVFLAPIPSHLPQQAAPKTLPSGVVPLLASTLLLGAQARQSQASKLGDGSGRIRTGCVEIDDYVLRGGVERGVVLGISADLEKGMGRVIALHLLASTLLASPEARGCIIDTTGNLPVSLLATIIKHRLTHPLSASKIPTSDSKQGQDADEKVRSILQRVAISRVFDLEGVWEIVGEVGKNCEAPRVSKGSSYQGNKASQAKAEKEREIGDSEGEDDAEDSPGRLGGESEEGHGGPEIVIIDNMTSIISELFARTERQSAHTLLTTLSHALHTLTTTHSLLTILLAATSTLPPSKTRLPSQPFCYSLFTSNPVRPLHHQTLSAFTSLSLMISTLPKTRADAELLFAEGARRKAESSQVVEVLEVLRDDVEVEAGRSREQRWCAFRVGGLGEIVTVGGKGERNAAESGERVKPVPFGRRV